MVKIREAIVVEGRYDKNTLSQVVDAPIIDLRSMTQGRGSYTMKFERYEEVPAANQAKIIEEAKAAEG